MPNDLRSRADARPMIWGVFQSDGRFCNAFEHRSAAVESARRRDGATPETAPHRVLPAAVDRRTYCVERGCGERVTMDATTRDTIGDYCDAHALEQRMMAACDVAHDEGE